MSRASKLIRNCEPSMYDAIRSLMLLCPFVVYVDFILLYMKRLDKRRELRMRQHIIVDVYTPSIAVDSKSYVHTKQTFMCTSFKQSWNVSVLIRYIYNLLTLLHYC